MTGGQGVASSNLASPTKQIHPIRPRWACIQPTFLPPSITPSYIDLVRGLPLTQLSLLSHADFPRAVDILLEGYRLVNGDAR